VLGHLERLKLKRVSELLGPISEQATKDSLSSLDFLDRLLEAEASSADWGSVFGDEVAAAAVMDRLLHYRRRTWSRVLPEVEEGPSKRRPSNRTDV
jgi:hypothetical protein